MTVVADDRLGGRFDQVGERGVREALLERRHRRRREDDVADQPQADEQDIQRVRDDPEALEGSKGQGSTVASSISMTGISSLIG